MRISDHRRELASALADRGTWSAVERLRDVESAVAGLDYRWLVDRAVTAARAQTWQPLTPEQLEALLEVDWRRLADDRAGLLEAVAVAARRLRVDPESFWTAGRLGAAEPLPEPELGQRLRSMIAGELSAVLVARTVTVESDRLVARAADREPRHLELALPVKPITIAPGGAVAPERLFAWLGTRWSTTPAPDQERLVDLSRRTDREALREDPPVIEARSGPDGPTVEHFLVEIPRRKQAPRQPQTRTSRPD